MVNSPNKLDAELANSNDYKDSTFRNEAATAKGSLNRTVMPPIKLPSKLEKRRPDQIKDFQRTQMLQDRLMADSAITSPL